MCSLCIITFIHTCVRVEIADPFWLVQRNTWGFPAHSKQPQFFTSRSARFAETHWIDFPMETQCADQKSPAYDCGCVFYTGTPQNGGLLLGCPLNPPNKGHQLQRRQTPIDWWLAKQKQLPKSHTPQTRQTHNSKKETPYSFPTLPSFSPLPPAGVDGYCKGRSGTSGKWIVTLVLTHLAYNCRSAIPQMCSVELVPKHFDNPPVKRLPPLFGGSKS